VPNDARTLSLALIVTVQVVAAPMQLPLQPVKLYPAAAIAFSVTGVPLANVPEQPLVPVQLMPEGFDVTVPLPAIVTCSG
jgi:hypothetical protein